MADYFTNLLVIILLIYYGIYLPSFKSIETEDRIRLKANVILDAENVGVNLYLPKNFCIS